MVRFLVLDVETDGNGTFRPPTQRPVEIAWSVLHNNNIIASHHYYVRGVTHIAYKGCKHTKEFFNSNGVKMSDALKWLDQSFRSHNVQYIVAHNVDFDKGVLMYYNKGKELSEAFVNAPTFCTMKHTTAICKLPSNSGYSSYKYPKLLELASHLSVPFDTSRLHGARYDVDLTIQCILRLASSNAQFKLLVHGSGCKTQPSKRRRAVRVHASDLTAKRFKADKQLDGASIMTAIHNLERHKKQVAAQLRKKKIEDGILKDMALDLENLGKRVDDETRLAIMAEPQHIDGKENVKWINARRHSQNGSNVTNIMGNGFCNAIKHCAYKLWPSTHTVNEIFCSWGNRNEDQCDVHMKKFLDKRVADPSDPLVHFNICHCGLVKETYDKGYSPDGYVEEYYSDGSSAVVLLEYKCPFTKRHMKSPDGRAFNFFDTNSVKTTETAIYGPITIPIPCKNVLTPNPLPKPLRRQSGHTGQVKAITPYYYDQVQWGMRVMSSCNILKTNPVHVPVMKCYFLVWTPQYTQLSVIPYDKNYGNYMLQMVNLFHERYYLPNLILKLARKLPYGKAFKPNELPKPETLPHDFKFKKLYTKLFTAV